MTTIAAPQCPVELKSLIRNVEDDFAMLRSHRTGAMSLLDIRRLLSKRLAAVEALEIQQASSTRKRRATAPRAPRRPSALQKR